MKLIARKTVDDEKMSGIVNELNQIMMNNCRNLTLQQEFFSMGNENFIQEFESEFNESTFSLHNAYASAYKRGRNVIKSSNGYRP